MTELESTMAKLKDARKEKEELDAQIRSLEYRVIELNARETAAILSED